MVSSGNDFYYFVLFFIMEGTVIKLYADQKLIYNWPQHVKMSDIGNRNSHI